MNVEQVEQCMTLATEVETEDKADHFFLSHRNKESAASSVQHARYIGASWYNRILLYRDPDNRYPGVGGVY